MNQSKGNVLFAIFAIVCGLILLRNLIDLNGIAIPDLTPMSPEARALCDELKGTISGNDAQEVAAIFKAAAEIARADGDRRNPFVGSTRDAKVRIENIGDIVIDWRFGDRYPQAVMVLQKYLDDELGKDFDRGKFAASMEVIAEALRGC